MIQSAMRFTNRENPWSHDAQMLLDEAGAILAVYAGDGRQSQIWFDDVCSARGGFFLVRTVHGTPLGCGGFRRFTVYMAEVIGMYSRPVGRRK